MPNKLWDSDLTNVCTVSVKNDPLCCSSTVVKKQSSKKFFGRGRFRLDIYKSFPLSSLLASPKKVGKSVWAPEGSGHRNGGVVGLCCRQQCGGREKERLACLSGFSQQTGGGGNGKEPWQTPHTLLQDSSHFVLRNRLSPLKLHKFEKSTGSKDDGRETKKKLFLLGRRGRKESAINVKGGASHPPRVQE